jgi:hypothetical protein
MLDPTRIAHCERATDALAPDADLCIAPRCDLAPEVDAPVPLCDRHLRLAFAYIVQRDHPDLSQRAEVTPHWSGSPAATGSVYFLRIDKLIKIGFTRKPAQRFRQLCPDAVLHLEPGTMRDERRCHAFAHARAYDEMFRPTDDLLAFIEGLRTATAA